MPLRELKAPTHRRSGRRRRIALALGVLVAFAATVAASDARLPTKPPRIIAAIVIDADRDGRADGVRLTYSTGIRHGRDRDGRYPFAIAGYRVASVGAASRNTLFIALVEAPVPDTNARPTIRYTRTRRQPVVSRAGRQAMSQVYRRVRPHRTVPMPPPASSPPASPPPASPLPADADGDGTPDAQDCSPRDAAVHPKAADAPDLMFVDSNCDGIDGTEAESVFASPTGNDANPGTRARPKRQIDAAVRAAGGARRSVLAAAGSYDHVVALTGIGIYGGYDPATWKRNVTPASIAASPEGILADGAKDVTLQLLRVRGVASGASAYGIRAINGSSLRLQSVTIEAGNGAAGQPGVAGARGRDGQRGAAGMNGSCDAKGTSRGGAGGSSPVGRDGGRGGDGHYESRGDDGAPGVVGTPGGKGGGAGSQGGFGLPGANGSNGQAGASGAGGASSTLLASMLWRGPDGVDGIYGAPGNGGGGGGASGGQTGTFVVNGTGNAGSGGGGGGEGGRGGGGGQAGGGSFAVYLNASSIVAVASTLTAGNGGAGGRGGNGGAAGIGGGGGPYIFHCATEIGRGASGGRGGDGGPGGGGGGGAGGPSVGVMKIGASSAILTSTAVVVGTPGPGGETGAGGIGGAPRAQPGLVRAVYP